MAMLDIQIACDEQAKLPKNADFEEWYHSALLPKNLDKEATLRIVDENESRTLNKQYREKDKSTNVLSFPSDLPEELEIPLLGDLVVCAKVVEHEATEQNKTSRAHWAHMLIHGTLHLQGFDHINEDDAEEMEALEIKILQSLGFDNPYEN